MARGATKTAEQTAQGIGKQAQTATSTGQTQENTAYSTLMPQITSMLQPGGNPAVTAATMGALGSRFGDAKQDVMDTATRTNNGASTNATLDSLARSQGSEAAQAAANNVASQQSTADKLLAGIFGQGSQNTNAGLGAQTGANNSYIGGINSGNQVLKSIAGLGGNAVSALGQIYKGAGSGSGGGSAG